LIVPCDPQNRATELQVVGSGLGLRYAARMPAPVLNRVEAAQRLAECEEEIRALGVSRLALFGSVLRGQTHAGSDVDIVVQFAPGAKTYDRFFALSELLERCLSRRVELVTTEALSPFIGPRILAEAEDVLRVP
jgi:predicted nucleotidyltransferase